MVVDAVFELLLVVALLFGGVWINRIPDKHAAALDLIDPCSTINTNTDSASDERTSTVGTDAEQALRQRLLSDSKPPTTSSSRSFIDSSQRPYARYRIRYLRVLGWHWTVWTPNSERYKDRPISRLLARFPFIVEACYWAIMYYLYQLGQIISALAMDDRTVDVARKHALQLAIIERKIHIEWEIPIQKYFMSHPWLMSCLNCLYAYLQIPATVSFLAFLYRSAITNRRPVVDADVKVYEAQRRTMASCNLLAFMIPSIWPCMPPHLLSDPKVPGYIGESARSFGFVDTVYGAQGAAAVWTHFRFWNQYAAMPSLHFAYSLIIGISICRLPLAAEHSQRKRRTLAPTIFIRLPSRARLLCVLLGILYPTMILIAKISTANYFLLHAVAGTIVCALGWCFNTLLLNLLPYEDHLLSRLRIHKPSYEPIEVPDQADDGDDRMAVIPV